PCFPAVSPGWDAAPRHNALPRTTAGDRGTWPGALVVVNETPGAFEALVRAALAYLNARPETPPILTIGCWNEWTEGQYILPDTRLGYGMLEALALRQPVVGLAARRHGADAERLRAGRVRRLVVERGAPSATDLRSHLRGAGVVQARARAARGAARRDDQHRPRRPGRRGLESLPRLRQRLGGCRVARERPL